MVKSVLFVGWWCVGKFYYFVFCKKIGIIQKSANAHSMRLANGKIVSMDGLLSSNLELCIDICRLQHTKMYYFKMQTTPATKVLKLCYQSFDKLLKFLV